MECAINRHLCPCPNDNCERHKKCCDCIASHLEKDSVPFCVFPKTGDKSFKTLYEKLKSKYE